MTFNADPNLAEYVSHDEFRTGLPNGRFRVIVNPKLARGYVGQRLWLLPVVLPIIGAGVALALSGSTIAGGLLVVVGIALNRAVVWNAGKILLYLASRDRSVYEFSTLNGIMEVRRV